MTKEIINKQTSQEIYFSKDDKVLISKLYRKQSDKLTRKKTNNVIKKNRTSTNQEFTEQKM